MLLEQALRPTGAMEKMPRGDVLKVVKLSLEMKFLVYSHTAVDS